MKLYKNLRNVLFITAVTMFILVIIKASSDTTIKYFFTGLILGGIAYICDVFYKNELRKHKKKRIENAKRKRNENRAEIIRQIQEPLNSKDHIA